MTPPALPPADVIRDNVNAALAEDVGPGDLTAELVPAAQRASARVISREAAIICGQAWFDAVFAALDADVSIKWHTDEGAACNAGDVLCILQGPARVLLTGERSALNFLQLLSATATVSRRYADAVAGTRTRILDTRKTLPGLRQAQKYAVRCGGADNHRAGLYDAFLVKENHIAAAGGIAAAVAVARGSHPDVLLEVEVETLEQLRECLDAGVDRVLLDNFSRAALQDAVAIRNTGKLAVGLEASGGITLDNVRAIAETGVDYISVGALTKDVTAIDLSMRFEFGERRPDST